MTQMTLINATLIEETTLLTRVEVSEKLRIPEQLLEEMQAEGLFTSTQDGILPQDFIKIAKACRLHQDLGVNLAGAALALELLEQIEQLEQELGILRRHF